MAGSRAAPGDSLPICDEIERRPFVAAMPPPTLTAAWPAAIRVHPEHRISADRRGFEEIRASSPRAQSFMKA